MSPECQFWLNWSVQALIALAMLATVIAALFGDLLRAHLWPPKLRLTVQGLGDKPVLTVLTSKNGTTENTSSWWCHLLVVAAGRPPKTFACSF